MTELGQDGQRTGFSLVPVPASISIDTSECQAEQVGGILMSVRFLEYKCMPDAQKWAQKETSYKGGEYRALQGEFWVKGRGAGGGGCWEEERAKCGLVEPVTPSPSSFTVKFLMIECKARAETLSLLLWMLPGKIKKGLVWVDRPYRIWAGKSELSHDKVRVQLRPQKGTGVSIFMYQSSSLPLQGSPIPRPLVEEEPIFIDKDPKGSRRKTCHCWETP